MNLIQVVIIIFTLNLKIKYPSISEVFADESIHVLIAIVNLQEKLLRILTLIIFPSMLRSVKL